MYSELNVTVLLLGLYTHILYSMVVRALRKCYLIGFMKKSKIHASENLQWPSDLKISASIVTVCSTTVNPRRKCRKNAYKKEQTYCCLYQNCHSVKWSDGFCHEKGSFFSISLSGCGYKHGTCRIQHKMSAHVFIANI